MNRLGKFSILVAILFEISCKAMSCTEESPRVNSNDGKFAVTIGLHGGCSGATGGFYTKVIVRKNSWTDRFSFGELVFFVKGMHFVRADWATNRHLVVSYPRILDDPPPSGDRLASDRRILVKEARAGDISVEYRAFD